MNDRYGSMYCSFDCIPTPPSKRGVLKTNSSMSVDQTLPVEITEITSLKQITLFKATPQLPT